MNSCLQLLLIFVCLVTSGICQSLKDTISTITSLPLGIGLDPELIEPEIQIYEDIFTSLTKDLSVQEAVDNYPKIFNETVFGNLGHDNVGAIKQFGFTPIFKGILRSPSGGQIVLQVAQDPELVIATLVRLLGNIDLRLLGRTGLFDLALTNWALVFTAPLLQEPYTEYVPDIIVQLTLWLINHFDNGVEQAKSVMEPLLDKLDQNGNLQGVFGDQALSEGVSNLLAQALANSEYQVSVDPEVVSKLVKDYIAEFQKQLDFDDQQMLQLIVDIFNQILEKVWTY